MGPLASDFKVLIKKYVDVFADNKTDSRGGKREGAGRKPSGKKKRNYYVTDQEHEEIKKLIEKMREGK